MRKSHLMKKAFVISMFLVAALAHGQSAPELSPEVVGVGQSIADELRSNTGADAAFIAAGFLKDNLKGKELGQALQYPADQVAVVRLTGRQIREALERSVSLYPSPNPAFLHISGLEVTFSRSAQPDSRITGVSINGAALAPNESYRVAMPMNLARGGLGYFTVWTKAAIEKADGLPSLESILTGKKPNDSPLRWKGSSV